MNASDIASILAEIGDAPASGEPKALPSLDEALAAANARYVADAAAVASLAAKVRGIRSAQRVLIRAGCAAEADSLSASLADAERSLSEARENLAAWR